MSNHISIDAPIPFTLSTPEGRRSAAEQIAAVAEKTPLPPASRPQRTLWRDPSLARWIGSTPASPRAIAARNADERLELVHDIGEAHLVSSLATDGRHWPAWDCDYEVTVNRGENHLSLVTFDTTSEEGAWDALHDFLFDLGWVAAALPKGDKPALYFVVPVRVLASSSPGHFHLYIDAGCSWGQYRELLELCRVAGVILGSVVPLSIQRGQTFLLRPGLTKAALRAQMEIFSECGSLTERIA
jgi:hypothetical protein